MKTFIEIFKELKNKIITEDYYYECKEYYEGCVQCKFWNKFNSIATDLILLEKGEEENDN